MAQCEYCGARTGMHGFSFDYDRANGLDDWEWDVTARMAEDQDNEDHENYS